MYHPVLDSEKIIIPGFKDLSPKKVSFRDLSFTACNTLFALEPYGFQKGIFGTGVEGAHPTVLENGLPVQVDTLTTTGFRSSFRTHIANLAHYMGDYLRQGGSLFIRAGEVLAKTHTGPDKFEWGFLTDLYGTIQEFGLTPVANRTHFGPPAWYHDKHPDKPFYQNPDYPIHRRDYAQAFTERFPTIALSCPENEPTVSALFSARYGWWNELMKGDKPFANALTNIVKAQIMDRMATEQVAVKLGLSQRIFLQNDSCELQVTAPGSGREQEAEFFNTVISPAAAKMMFGIKDTRLYDWLLKNDVPMDRLTFIEEHGRPDKCVFGVDFYNSCVRELHTDRSKDRSWDWIKDPYLLDSLIRNRYDVLGMPMLGMEVNADGLTGALVWQDTFDIVGRLRNDGYPIGGATYFSLNDQDRWSTSPVGLPPLTGEVRIDRRGLLNEGIFPEPALHVFRDTSQKGFGQLPYRFNQSQPLVV